MKQLSKVLATLGIVAGTALLTGFQTYENVPMPNGWPMAGQNKQNTAFQSREHIISPSNVGQLQAKWIYNTEDNDVLVNQIYGKSSVLGTPSVDKQNKTIYFGDINGRIHAVDAKTGQAIWIKSVVYDYLADVAAEKGLDITKIHAFTRTTPAIFANMIIFGIRNGCVDGSFTGPVTYESMVALGGGTVLAVSRKDGQLIWKQRIAPNSQPLGVISGAVTVYGNTVYGGLATLNEETWSPTPDAQAVATQIYQALDAPLPPGGTYHCCGGNGLTFALNAATGEIKYIQSTIDPSLPRGFGGWNGASVWAVTNPPVDHSSQTVYHASGNLYNVSNDPATQSCLAAAGADVVARTACMPDGVYQDAILALDYKTGAIKWARPYYTMDVGGSACILASFGTPGTGCNDPLALPFNPLYLLQSYADVDFGQNPMLTEVNGNETLIISQKSGIVYAIDPATGQIRWSTFTGAGSIYGGSQFGSATDGVRVYNQNTNGGQLQPDFTNIFPSVLLVNEFNPTPAGPGGFFTALDAETGAIVWQTRDPNALTIDPKYIVHASPYGNVTVANGVVYGTSTNHTLLAMSAETGEILWQNDTLITGGGFAPPAIVEGTLYWPTGVAPITVVSASPSTIWDADDPFDPFDNKVIAFSVPNATGFLDNSPAPEDDSLN